MPCEICCTECVDCVDIVLIPNDTGVGALVWEKVGLGCCSFALSLVNHWWKQRPRLSSLWSHNTPLDVQAAELSKYQGVMRHID